jgi:transposase
MGKRKQTNQNNETTVKKKKRKKNQKIIVNKTIPPWYSNGLVNLATSVHSFKHDPDDLKDVGTQSNKFGPYAKSWIKIQNTNHQANQNAQRRKIQFSCSSEAEKTYNQSCSLLNQKIRVYVNARSKTFTENSKTTHLTRCFKIRIKPTSDQKKRIQQAFDICRTVRRQALNLIHKDLKLKGFEFCQTAPKLELLRDKVLGVDVETVLNNQNKKIEQLELDLLDAKEEETNSGGEKNEQIEKIEKQISKQLEFNKKRQDFLDSDDYKDTLNVFHLKHQDTVFDNNLCPKDLKVATLQKLCSAIGSTIESRKAAIKKAQEKGFVYNKRQMQRFHMKHQTLHDPCQSLYLDNNGGNPPVTWSIHQDKDQTHKDKYGFKIYPRWMKGELIAPYHKRDMKKLCELFQSLDMYDKRFDRDILACSQQVTLKYERGHGYFLILPYLKPKVNDQSLNNTTKTQAIALDPGVRVFQSGFDSSGCFSKFGEGGADRLFDYCDKIDKSISKLNNFKNKRLRNKNKAKNSKQSQKSFTKEERCKKKKLKEKILGYRSKLKNLKQDFHWQLSSYLCSRYENILLPRFNVSEMVVRKRKRKTSSSPDVELKVYSRKLNNKTARKLLNWNHFQFRERLQHKAEELSTSIFDACERYTTQACMFCHHLDPKIGGKKVYHCKNPLCINHEVGFDRDLNASCNIFVKNVQNYLGDSYSIVPL